ncbi:MAG: hypothetical protein CO117_05155 [Flavobacteriaceae bacterium CG_4_9_14_3_um_filter_33_16]|nr:MAG: hypothetical protein CO117_05155 [Flavobacteriaceae bacterium CG_4_9_14_3_um_filter_33_16]
MTKTEKNEKIVRLKNFESSLLQLRHSIRSTKHELRRNVINTPCDKTKNLYKKKVKDYIIKELHYLMDMTI